MTEHTVHFTVTGEFIAGTARDMLCEGRPDSAYRLLDTLRDGGDRAPERLIRQVLDGTHTLTGTSDDGIDAVEEWHPPLRRTAYMDRRYFAMAGLRRLGNGTWWRPVARVTSWGPDDLGARKNRRRGRRGERSEWYCADDERILDAGTDPPGVMLGDE